MKLVVMNKNKNDTYDLLYNGNKIDTIDCYVTANGLVCLTIDPDRIIVNNNIEDKVNGKVVHYDPFGRVMLDLSDL